MDIGFRKFSEFQKGIMVRLLRDAYSFESRYERDWLEAWKMDEAFFFDNLSIADRCGFVTVFHESPIGFICWDPRNSPASMEIGHNCIATEHKGKKFGKVQLQEAVRRIKEEGVQKIIVTTDERLVPAQKNYESVGFRFVRERVNEKNPEYAGRLMDYEMVNEQGDL
ncbi:MAG: GNAT family N-acetyltransferase [Clostridium sp.]|nr:GNAT family N-acetyltransferase [Clostridium sp.]MCM1499758.1 GNAT family N-acetyltransferase [Clostridium sp.]